MSPITEPPQKSPLPESPDHTWRNIRIAIWGLALLLVAIILLQNWEKITIHLLFIDIKIPPILFALIALVLGFLLGLITPSLWAKRAKSKS